MTHLQYSREVIARFGGTVQMASICRIKPQSVSSWKKDGIPESRDMYLRLLKPSVFDGLPSYPTK